MNGWAYRLAADAVLVLHFGFVLFVIGGVVLIWVGRWAGVGVRSRPPFPLAAPGS